MVVVVVVLCKQEKQTGKIREALVLCYGSFSCHDITVRFPQGWREERAERGRGEEEEGKKKRKVEPN